MSLPKKLVDHIKRDPYGAIDHACIWAIIVVPLAIWGRSVSVLIGLVFFLAVIAGVGQSFIHTFEKKWRIDLFLKTGDWNQRHWLLWFARLAVLTSAGGIFGIFLALTALRFFK